MAVAQHAKGQSSHGYKNHQGHVTASEVC